MCLQESLGKPSAKPTPANSLRFYLRGRHKTGLLPGKIVLSTASRGRQLAMDPELRSAAPCGWTNGSRLFGLPFSAGLCRSFVGTVHGPGTCLCNGIGRAGEKRGNAETDRDSQRCCPHLQGFGFWYTQGHVSLVHVPPLPRRAAESILTPCRLVDLFTKAKTRSKWIGESIIRHRF
ncbi:hypothetical protein FA13DRAFT_947930 [Coprinellus micaceus]|uniref:Uncharacterized protein n=1 Tax=Coprinellus micaceus TaxID=71717 RepID=A0A4Y7T061_COPMI|nr:hypothetical protein FA13DRAFT_947930 [Coprinellus micaceus]